MTEESVERTGRDEPEAAQAGVQTAAAEALSAYREALAAGRPMTIEQLVQALPHAEAAIRQAITAFEQVRMLVHEATAARAALPRLPMPRLPGYRLMDVLGQGGMGIVYSAIQESLQRPVAIKLLAPHLEQEPGLIARFEHEIRLLTQLTHPNIVYIIDAGVADGRHFYVMEHVDGLSLGRILPHHRIPQHTAVVILHQIVSGLAAAHRRGILHRDLKPANVLLDRLGVVRIVDFGLGAIFRGEVNPARVEQRVGTQGYMAPEQARDPRLCTPQSDVYSVGVMFYQMLTGRLPGDPYAPVAEGIPGVTSETDRLIRRCLASDPAERNADGSSLLRSVKRLERRIYRTRKRMRAIREGAPPPAPVATFDTPPQIAEELGEGLQRVAEAWPTLAPPQRMQIMGIIERARRAP